jgi:hypothetical protein
LAPRDRVIGRASPIIASLALRIRDAPVDSAAKLRSTLRA